MATTTATTGQAIKATSRARSILVERHQDEYAVILGDEREKNGLSRIPGGVTKETAQTKIAKQQAKLEKMLAEYKQTYGD